MTHAISSAWHAFVGLAACAALVLPQTAAAQPSPPADGPPRIPMTMPADPRTQERSYTFAPTGEEMEYTLFVSSKVKPDVPAPLIVALHGMGGDSKFIARERLIDLAEEGGYVVVAPMGYNTVGWYGSPVIVMGGGAPDPANLTELSELDVMTVTQIARSEFNIDSTRMYLMGHSMGGAGTLFLGQKHAEYWAAIAAIAPAAFMMQPVQKDILAPLKAAGIPVMITEGTLDNVVPPESVRTWAAAASELGMAHEYLEIEGMDHGTIIGASMPEIFRFFGEHNRTPPPPPALRPRGGPPPPSPSN
jgi:poly(3-hydroxybutyrate) depolymerase